MPKLPQPRVIAFAGAATATGLIAGFAIRPPDFYLAGGLAGLMLSAVLIALVDPHRSSIRDGGAMPLSFIIDFSALLLFGPSAMTLVATAGIVASALSSPAPSILGRAAAMGLIASLAATQASGYAHAILGGAIGQFTWPWQGIPIAAAVASYCLVLGASTEAILAISNRQPVNRSWSKTIRKGFPSYFVGAAIAAALAELVVHRAWQVAPVVAVPLYFAYRAYATYFDRVEVSQRLDAKHRREIDRHLDGERRPNGAVESIDYGVAVLDHKGGVTLWSDILARLLGCPSEHAVGRSLVGALPALGNTILPSAILDAVKQQSPRTLPYLSLPLPAGSRILMVKILPDNEGVTLLWQDVTEQARAEHALRRSEERLALAAEGANDGLWEWDIRSHELYLSARWKAMIGLPAKAGSGRPEEWLDRVHAEDLAALKEALDAYLSGRTDHFQHEHRIRHEDGTYKRFLCRGVAARVPGRRSTRIAGSLTDVTERALRERIHGAGFSDALTGLCNRSVFVEGLGQRLREFKERGGNWFAILYLDLDRFKVVNDSLGHLVGDELIMGVSRRLEATLRPGDTLARLGGDEFAILLNGLGDATQANAIALRIQSSLGTPFSIGGREVFTSASLGIAFCRPEYTNPEELMRDADTAMYQAKANGRARHELFDSDMHARALDRLGLENDLRHAVKSNAFEVYYQPIVSLSSGMCIGFESLVRWRRNGEPISPATFIPVAEELGLIDELGTGVLQEACRSFADWKRRYPESGLDYITVNVSTRQLMQQNFLHVVERAVEAAQMKPSDLRLEITETAIMDNPQHAAEVLRGLREFGPKIYLDDFGTGYSSLSHLHKLPVDALKIDGSFVRSLLLHDRPAIVESILALARTLETSVIAEGVESDLQARELERLGCRHAQGYFFSPALAARAVEELLESPRRLGRREQVVTFAKEPQLAAVPPSSPEMARAI